MVNIMFNNNTKNYLYDVYFKNSLKRFELTLSQHVGYYVLAYHTF